MGVLPRRAGIGVAAAGEAGAVRGAAGFSLVGVGGRPSGRGSCPVVVAPSEVATPPVAPSVAGGSRMMGRGLAWASLRIASGIGVPSGRRVPSRAGRR